jgi:hypothetical protein
MIYLVPDELDRLRAAAGPLPAAVFVRLLLSELLQQREREAAV